LALCRAAMEQHCHSYPRTPFAASRRSPQGETRNLEGPSFYLPGRNGAGRSPEEHRNILLKYLYRRVLFRREISRLRFMGCMGLWISYLCLAPLEMTGERRVISGPCRTSYLILMSQIRPFQGLGLSLKGPLFLRRLRRHLPAGTVILNAVKNLGTSSK